jgi:hypothetical protein
MIIDRQSGSHEHCLNKDILNALLFTFTTGDWLIKMINIKYVIFIQKK